MEKLDGFSSLQRVLVSSVSMWFSGVGAFLGLGVGSRDMTFNIPDLKMTRVVHWAEDLLQLDMVSVKSLAGFVGLLQSLRKATGPIVSVMTRSLYREIVKARSWSSFCKLTELAHFELSWWKDNIQFLSK